MLAWLAGLFGSKPRQTVGAITQPTRMHLEARVASPNTLTSPLTGTTAALLMVTVVERRIFTSDGGIAGSREAETYHTIGSTLLGTELELLDAAGTVIHVPAAGLQVKPLFETGGNTLSNVPPFLHPLVARASGGHVLCFRESAFREGDRVRLRATIGLEATAPAQGYRSGVSQRAVASVKYGPVVLVEMM
jgi:hypothetical protein